MKKTDTDRLLEECVRIEQNDSLRDAVERAMPDGMVVLETMRFVDPADFYKDGQEKAKGFVSASVAWEMEKLDDRFE